MTPSPGAALAGTRAPGLNSTLDVVFRPPAVDNPFACRIVYRLRDRAIAIRTACGIPRRSEWATEYSHTYLEVATACPSNH
jgi:hypothetical protein